MKTRTDIHEWENDEIAPPTYDELRRLVALAWNLLCHEVHGEDFEYERDDFNRWEFFSEQMSESATAYCIDDWANLDSVYELSHMFDLWCQEKRRGSK